MTFSVFVPMLLDYILEHGVNFLQFSLLHLM